MNWKYVEHTFPIIIFVDMKWTGLLPPAAPQSTKPQKLDIIEPATSRSAAAASNIEVSTEKAEKFLVLLKLSCNLTGLLIFLIGTGRDKKFSLWVRNIL